MNKRWVLFMKETLVLLTYCQGYSVRNFLLCIYHCKNTWVTSTTFLDCLSCNATKVSLFFRRPIWLALFPGHSQIFSCTCGENICMQDKIWDWPGDKATIWLHSWHFYHNHATKELDLQMYYIKGMTNLPRNCCILKGDTNLTKEGSFSTTLWFKL